MARLSISKELLENEPGLILAVSDYFESCICAESQQVDSRAIHLEVYSRQRKIPFAGVHVTLFCCKNESDQVDILGHKITSEDFCRLK